MAAQDKKRKGKKRVRVGVSRTRTKGRGQGRAYHLLSAPGGSRRTRRRAPRRWAACPKCPRQQPNTMTYAPRVFRTRLPGYEGQNTLCLRHR